jgi:FkbM family methyltransferase
MKQLIKRALSRLGYRVQYIGHVPPELLDAGTRRNLEFDDVICRRMFERSPELTFLQIGAFDGMTQDPLRKYIERFGWRGVLVEPQAALTDGLRRMYAGNPRITVMHAAIDTARGNRTLFSADPAVAPGWARSLASFDRAHVVKHGALIPGLETMITEEEVPCILFADVLDRLGSSELDLLQIDTEGADARMLSLFPFEQIKPAIVQWEISHLSRADRAASLRRLAQFGYRFAESGSQDMLAVRP